MPNFTQYGLQGVEPVSHVQKYMERSMALKQRKLAEAQAAMKQNQQQEMNTALTQLSENPTIENINSTIARYPVLGKELNPMAKRMQEGQSEEAVKAQSSLNAMVFSALSKGQPQVAIERLNDLADKAEANGMKAMAVRYRDTADQIDKHPKIMQMAIGLRMDPAKLKEMQEREGRAGRLSTQSKYVDAQRKKLEGELRNAAAAGDGVIPAKERPDWELKLRNQYLKEGGEDFEAIDRMYQNILGASMTGVGALTTILSFMKTIDPTSVVTGGEAATAKNAPGWTETMRNLYNRVLSEGEMGEEAVKQFKDEALKIRNNAGNRARTTQSRIQKQAEGYGLNVGNIFTEGRIEAATDGNTAVETTSNLVEKPDGGATLTIGTRTYPMDAAQYKDYKVRKAQRTAK